MNRRTLTAQRAIATRRLKLWIQGGRSGPLWIDLKRLARRWDVHPTTAARIARANKMHILKLGKARNASVKVMLNDIEIYEKNQAS